MIGFRGWRMHSPRVKVVREIVYAKGKDPRFLDEEQKEALLEALGELHNTFYATSEEQVRTYKSSITSLTRPERWPEKFLKAKCPRYPKGEWRLEGGTQPHVAPVKECTCGIYAHYQYTETFKEFTYEQGTFVLGLVQGWGKQILHETGFRAQYLQILAFVLPQVLEPKGQEAFEALSQKYEVPLLTVEQAIQMQDEYSVEWKDALKRHFAVEEEE